jgi:hypothetical protein
LNSGAVLFEFAFFISSKKKSLHFFLLFSFFFLVDDYTAYILNYADIYNVLVSMDEESQQCKHNAATSNKIAMLEKSTIHKEDDCSMRKRGKRRDPEGATLDLWAFLSISLSLF